MYGILRIFVVLLILCWYVICASGVPFAPFVIPVGSTGAERYPCESCGCGCDSAEHCWRSCCCHSLAERLAWAEREGVTPPEYVLTVAHCAAGTECAAESNCARGIRKNRGVRDGATVRYVSILQSMRCRGQWAQWLSVGACVVPQHVFLAVSDELCGELLLVDAKWSDFDEPPTPPPPEQCGLRSV